MEVCSYICRYRVWCFIMQVMIVGAESQGVSMAKRLEDMSLEELWELFPVELSPHREEWSVWAAVEMASISEMLRDFKPVISHVGSTALPGIMAKPVVDILVEIDEKYDPGEVRTMLIRGGYICMSESPGRLSFNKGYTPAGYAERIFHVHVRRMGDNDEIVFRDYLAEHPEVAKEYEELKRSLLPRYRHDRDGYTEAKTEFVRRIMSMARRQPERM